MNPEANPARVGFAEAIAACCKSLQECAIELQEGRKNNNGDQVSRVAHRLKGVTGSYGLLQLQTEVGYLREAVLDDHVISSKLAKKILDSIKKATDGLTR